MSMKTKAAFITLIIVWSSLDLPSFAAMLVFTAGLMLAAYIWRRWGGRLEYENGLEEY